MAPNKSRTRGHQPQPSDYETDAQPTVHVPPPRPRSNEELNIAVIRRHYPEVTSIVYLAPYVVLYDFELDTQKWNKWEIEGTLFLCELVPSPTGAERYSAVILNRRGPENFSLEIDSPENIQVEEEMRIIIMPTEEKVYGIWVFSEAGKSTANTLNETSAKITELASRAKESREAAERADKNGTAASEQVETSVPMGRQLSLRELFSQQREQDSAWSVHNHHNPQQMPPTAPPSNFMPSPSPQLGSNDVLSHLFMRAKQDYNGAG